MSFYRHVAQHIVSRHQSPDLRGAIVLLPNYHAAEPLAQALSKAAGLPALLLPQMTTLGDWVETVPFDAPVQSDTQRISALYSALRERKWFPDANLWSLSRELLALMDELTRHHVSLPDSAEEFARQLGNAYQARAGQAMQFEARVVHELWYAMAASGDMDVSAAYQLRLGALVRKTSRALYVLQTCDLPAVEMQFLQSCRERVEVNIFDMREMASFEPACALFFSALQQDMGSSDLLSQAAELKKVAASLSAPSIMRTVRLFGAQGLEQEAQAADVQVRRWLLEGKKCIAVVVQDRLVARRLRALLERAQVEVQDETGWTFATLSVSTVLIRWLEAVQGDYYYQDVLDLFKSPFLFADNPVQRKQSAYLFEQMVRRHGVVAHLQDYIALAEREVPELLQPLVRLRQAAAVLSGKAAPLTIWLQALNESLEILGVIAGWRQDAAGQQLLQLLAIWQEELHADTAAYSFSEWRRWLSQQLDLNTYRDVSVDSPVLFTHLSATRWRSFDAVILLGSDAAHLPAPANSGQWFNDAVRTALGLPTSHAVQRRVRDDLLSLLAMNDQVLVTWQASRNGEPNLLSPYFEMLRAQHILAFGHDPMDKELGEIISHSSVISPSRNDLELVSVVAQGINDDMTDLSSQSELSCFTGPLRSQSSILGVAVASQATDTARPTPSFSSWRFSASCSVGRPSRPCGRNPQSLVCMPRPVVTAELMPTHISPSGYNALVACPYQYFARHVLGLNEIDEVREALDKRDYGTWVHAVLQRFHTEMPVLQEQDRGEADAVMRCISEEVFSEGTLHDYLAQAWLLRWQALIPAYLDWQLQNEEAGWRYQGSEVPFNVEVETNLQLRGRLDRVDVNAAGEILVLDYKTQSATVLKNKLKEPGEDVQLACYAQAVKAVSAEFVSLDGDAVLAVASPGEITELAQLNIERLQTVFSQMRAGAALSAHGAEKVCNYCEMRGLCRRGENG